jgi:cysteine desulfurase
VVYLDWNAANPPHPRAVAAAERALRAAWANPSSPHAEGRAARALVEEARESVARAAGAAPGEVVFASSGTEALNAAVHGVVAAARRAGDPRPHVVASAVEHKAVLEPLEALARAGEAEVELAPVDARGRLDLAAFERLLRPGRTRLACVIAAQNETGTVQPIDAAASVASGAGARLLVDAAQAFGRLERAWPFDLVAISGHKVRAVRGAAALVVRRGTALEPLLRGGGQELGRRAGSEDVAAIAALGEACRLERDPRLLERRGRFEEALLRAVPELVVIAREAERLPQTVAVLVPGESAETLLAGLDLAGVRASSGSACSSGALEPSHVLRAMRVDDRLARSMVRFSFGPDTTDVELASAAAALGEVVARARAAR